MPDVSKVNLNGNTLMDVTQDTVNSGNLLAGETATMNNGSKTVGTVSLDGYALKAMLAPVETATTASAAYTAGEFLIHNDALYIATRNIAIGDTFSSSNTEEVKTADELDGLYRTVADSFGASYEPMTIASRNYNDGELILVRGYGLYYAEDLAAGDDITNHPDTTSTDLSSLIQDSLAIKANIASPTFTGTPKAPTAASGTNTTQIATTEFVANSISSKANLASPTFTGTPKAPTAASGTNNTQIATTEFVANSISSKANLTSPSFTGTPTAPTAASGTNTTQIATTAFVQDAVANSSGIKVNPNLIRNWYFIGGGSQQGNGQLPINRSRKTIFSSINSGVESIIDNFYVGASQNNGAVLLESDGLVLEQNADYGFGGSYFSLEQNLYSLESLRGVQVTLSVLVTEFQKVDADGKTGSVKIRIGTRTGSTWTYATTGNITGTGLFSITTKLGTTFDTLGTDICRLENTGSGTRIKIAACKLEIGNTQTLVHQENNTWVLNEIPDYNEQLIYCESVPLSPKTTDSKSIAHGFGQVMTNNAVTNPNLLRNAIFATNGTKLPINSRGQTSYYGSGNTIDGWFLRNSSGGDGSGQPQVSLVTSGLDLRTNGATHGNLQGFHQSVSDFQSLAGKTVTLSVLIISNISSGSKCDFGAWNSTSAGTNNTTITDSIVDILNSTGLVTKTFIMPDSLTNGYLNVGIFPSTNSDIKMTIAGMKLELGDIQTLAHMVDGDWVLNEYPNYSEEVARCLTSSANTADVYTDFDQVFGKLTASGNPYIRFYTGDGKAFQLSYSGSPLKLLIESYDGSTWTTLAKFTPDT